MVGRRSGRVALVCALLAVLLALPACDRKHDERDFLPTAPAVADALLILLSSATVPADGFTTVAIEAQIDPAANHRKIRFKTTLGKFVEQDPEDQVEVDKEADSEGRASVQLRSDPADPKIGTAVVTVEARGPDASNNEVALITKTVEIEFVRVLDAISLVASPETNFADGFSPVNLEAQISAGSPPAWKTVVFRTSRGTIDGAAANTDVMVSTDSQRIARAQLTSSELGTARVSAKIMEFSEATVTILVEFSERNPNLISLGTSAATVPADNASQINVFADIEARATDRTVEFTTSRGTFPQSTASVKTTITATADNSNRATVQLQSDTTIGPVFLTATVANTSAEAVIDFIRALPDRIDVSVGNFTWDKSADPERMITATLSRDVGEVSEGTEVEWTIVRASDDTEISDAVFFDILPSGAGGVATAMLFIGSSTFEGQAIVRAKVPGSGAGEGEETVNIVP